MTFETKLTDTSSGRVVDVWLTTAAGVSRRQVEHFTKLSKVKNGWNSGIWWQYLESPWEYIQISTNMPSIGSLIKEKGFNFVKNFELKENQVRVVSVKIGIINMWRKTTLFCQVFLFCEFRSKFTLSLNGFREILWEVLI